MIIDFQVEGATDLVVDIPEADIPYWLVAYKLVFGVVPEPVASPGLTPCVEMPFDSVGNARGVMFDD